MDREELRVLEELVEVNNRIASSLSGSEYEARMLAMENMAYQEVIQKVKMGACSLEEQRWELEAIWDAVAGATSEIYQDQMRQLAI